LSVDTSGNLWVATQSGIYRWMETEFIKYDVPGYEDSQIELLELDGDEEGWMVVPPGKLIRFKKNSVSEVSLLDDGSSLTVFDIAQYQANALWVATDRGLFLLNGASKERFTVLNGLASNVILSVFIDREGLVWYGSDNGLGKISGTQFRQLYPNEFFRISTVFDITRDRDDRIWLAGNEGLICYDEKQIKVWDSRDGLDSDYTSAIQAMSDGDLLVATNQWVYRVSGTEVKLEIDKAFQSIRDLVIDTFNGVWIVDIDSIYHYSQGVLKILNTELKLPENLDLVSMFFEGDSRIWILTDGQGAFFHDTKSATTSKVLNLPSKNVYSICTDHTGINWIGTSHGACMLENTEVKMIFNESHGLASQSIWTVAPDASGKMWFSTSRGLSCLDQGRIYNFDVDDGVSGDDLTSNCTLIDKSGRLWFGGFGITIVNPAPGLPKIAPRTYIRWARVNGSLIYPGATIPHGNNTFEFGLLCQSYLNEDRNMYRYEMQGFDNFRSQATSSSFIRYTNLPSGEFQLLAESMNRDGVWSDEPAVFEFTVSKAWWELYWVQMLFGMSSILVIILLARFRSATIQKRALRLESEVDRQTAVIQGQVKELARQKGQLEKIAVTDDLTGLYNRRYFFRMLTKEWTRQRRYGHPLSILLIDIDDFKSYNDTFGHAIGDQILKKVSIAIQELIRETDTLARYGGEEFILLMPETDQSSALDVANRIRVAVSEISFDSLSGSEIQVQLSGGVSCKHKMTSTLNPDSLIQQADIALYKAKKAGKNQILVFDQ